MNPAGTPSPFSFLPTSLLLLAIGWGGLFTLFNFTEPFLLPRWVFFFLVVVAFTGIALPVSSFFNYRFPSDPPATVRVILRQALWAGVYATTLAWLLYGRVFNLGLAAILAIAFMAIEWFIRLREKTRWNPED
jgi:hypothetical protein